MTIPNKFTERYVAKKLPNCTNHYIEDGIINPKKFSDQEIKILFIAKEHNYLGQSDYEKHGSSYSTWCNDHVKFRFAHRIGEWAFGMMHDFPELDAIDYDKKLEAWRCIAFINGNCLGSPLN